MSDARRCSISVALSLLLAQGCTPMRQPTSPRIATASGSPATHVTGASAAPNVSPGTPVAPAVATTLTGQVRLELDNPGGNIISNNGGQLVSDNGAGVVANNSGNLISNNGGALTSKVKRTLLAAAPREVLLADAVVSVEDAAGKPILTPDGKPVTGTTNKQGTYTITATLPNQNVVLRVKLWQGGELSALVAKDTGATREASIDTSTTLGATYVLQKFVQGDQSRLDKLPASEVTKLHDSLGTASAALDHAPSYEPQALVDLAQALSDKTPAVAATLSEIKALLLGQARLGNGQKATSVAIYEPRALSMDPSGNLNFIEPLFGRVRQVLADGTLTTYADVVRGKLSRNFPGASSMVWAPDGTFYVAADTQVVKVTPDGKVTSVAGNLPSLLSSPAPGGSAPTVEPWRLALAPDGTVYIGEAHTSNADTTPPRLLKVTPDGTMTPIHVDDTWPNRGLIAGLLREADGTLDVLYDTQQPGSGALYSVAPDGTVKVLASGLNTVGNLGGLARGADGTLYVSQSASLEVTAIAPDGSQRTVAGQGAAGSASAVNEPSDLLMGKDGTLYIADIQSHLIDALAPDGTLRVYAGTNAPANADPNNLSLDSPTGVVFDAAGNVVFSEHGGHRILRMASGKIDTLAGRIAGFAGDGGPAVGALLSYPDKIAYAGQDLIISDNGNNRIRKIAADGTISTLVSGKGGEATLGPDERRDATDFSTVPTGLAVGPDGLIYWCCLDTHQILRLAKDGKVELVAGKAVNPDTNTSVLTQYINLGPQQEATGPAKQALLGAPMGLTFDAKGDLYVADSGSLLIRKITGLDTPNPTISRVLGHSSFDAVGPAATDDDLQVPSAIQVDAAGNLIVAESGTASLPLIFNVPDDYIKSLPGFGVTFARVRKFSPDGKVKVIAGPGSSLFPDPQGDDALVMPRDLALAPDGRLAIADSGANQLHILPAGSF